jgi:hypothetical protein
VQSENNSSNVFLKSESTSQLYLLNVGSRQSLCRAPLIFFERRETLVEGEGLLYLLKALHDALESDAIGLFDSVQALILRIQALI